MENTEELIKKRQELQDLKKRFNIDMPVEDYIKLHIKKLHEYNEVKDVGQALMGMLAEREQTTTREMYKKYNLDLAD